MKILGTEKHRYASITFSVHVVDIIDSTYTVNVKTGFFTNADTYRKHVFTNGSIEKTSVSRTDSHYNVKFKIIEGDWLIIVDERGNLSVYINEQYCGPIKVRNKKVQERVDISYVYCRNRIDSKRDFAKRMGTISRELNLPFQIVLAFKGNKELLDQMVENVSKAIANRLYDDSDFMAGLSGDDNDKRIKAIETVGIIKVPSFQAEKISQYIYDCLVNRKIIRRFE